MSRQGKVALVTGVGPGTGAAIVRRLGAGGYRVALLARDGDRLSTLQTAVAGSKAFVCDVADEAKLHRTMDQVEETMGSPRLVVHNAVGGTFGTFQDIEPAILTRNFQINVVALLHLARRFAPAMVAAGDGALIATGNTSALRGKANFAGFAPTKAAQRILAEAMARELGPKGVHVAYIVIDAVIDVPWTRKRHPEAKDDFFIQPRVIAEEVWHLAHQDKSAWSFNVELRPFREPW
jgi:NAD(P)-dependent dehydrogenase (short-subunit alcohol dehydrogenase family)